MSDEEESSSIPLILLLSVPHQSISHLTTSYVSTKECITLSDNICGWINSRSRFARIGLMSHVTAPFISPGISNKQVLEIFNASKRLSKS